MGMRGLDPSIILFLIPLVFVGIIIVAFIGARDVSDRGEKIDRFFSISSNAAIFFTVLALVYQVTASEDEARRASYADVLDTYYEINRLQIEHPDVWQKMYPEEGEFAQISETDRLALQYTYFTLNFFERLYLLHRDSVIDDERWKAWEVWIQYSMSTSPIFRDVWHQSCGLHHSDFVRYIETTYDDGSCQEIDSQDAASTPAGTS